MTTTTKTGWPGMWKSRATPDVVVFKDGERTIRIPVTHTTHEIKAPYTILNSFRRLIDHKMVKGWTHIHKDREAGIDTPGYYSGEAIADNEPMREQVIDDITRRTKMLAGQLKMWKLTPEEQADLFTQLADAIAGRKKVAEATPPSRRPSGAPGGIPPRSGHS